MPDIDKFDQKDEDFTIDVMVSSEEEDSTSLGEVSLGTSHNMYDKVKSRKTKQKKMASSNYDLF